MGVDGYGDLMEHKGHNIECVTYGDDNVALECIDCNCVLVDFDKYPDKEYDDGG